ncbi:MAG: ABC transporter ATP-binding protein [Gemmatimonadota bacterium]
MMNSTLPQATRPLPTTNALIRMQDVNKHYETKAGRTNILNHVDLVVRDGEFLSIMGPSGAGKTSLLNILGMFDADWTGSFEFAGQAVHGLKPKARRELGKKFIGFVFQQYHLLDDLTVYENLEIPLSYRDVKRSERAAIVADALDRFNMVAKKDLYPSQLSGGQQQLVAVARATIADPKVILADEPTGSLHSSQGQMIMELLGELNVRGTTIVQVTHSEVNAGYGHRTIELRDGWIVDT